MKKFLALIMALLMMLSLVACGDNAEKTDTDADEEVEEEESSDKKDKENKDDADADADKDVAADEDADVEEDVTEAAPVEDEDADVEEDVDADVNEGPYASAAEEFLDVYGDAYAEYIAEAFEGYNVAVQITAVDNGLVFILTFDVSGDDEAELIADVENGELQEVADSFLYDVEDSVSGVEYCEVYVYNVDVEIGSAIAYS